MLPRRPGGEKAIFATTRILSGMTPGKSIVAFYGDAKLANQLLSVGIFAGYARVETPRGEGWLAGCSLYNEGNRPRGIKGLIALMDFQVVARGQAIDSLGGTIEGTNLPLRANALPPGPARTQVYFVGAAGESGNT